MKNKISIIITLLLVFLFTNCQEDFLVRENKNQLTTETFYKTVDDFQLAMNSCYGGLMGPGMFGNKYHYWFNSFDDRILFETTNLDRLSINSTFPTLNRYDIPWIHLYYGLYRTSKLLEQLDKKGIDGIEGMDEKTMTNLTAEAKGLRAMYYFYLVIIYDRPIFYNEENVPNDVLADMGNGEQIQFWDQITQDLQDAIPDLPLRSELAEEDYGRVTKGGARALLGKAMLFKHYYYHVRFGNKGAAEDLADLQIAKQAFIDLMNSNEYSLVLPQAPKTQKDYLYALLSNSAFMDLPSENNLYKSEYNQESIWEVMFTNGPIYYNDWWLPGGRCAGALNAQYYGPHTNSYRNHEINPSLYFVFESEGAPAGFEKDPRCYATIYLDGDTMDFRPESNFHKGFASFVNDKGIARARNLTLPNGTNAPDKSNSCGLKKYFFPVFDQGTYAPGNDPTNRRVIRYADVLLMYAEVMYILGDDGTGLNALNQVRQRVDMPIISNLTPEAIRHERDVELAAEGHRWFDLVRWSFDPEWKIDWNNIDWGIDGNNPVNPFVEGKHEFMPIPLQEVDVNGGKLEQNPGY